MICSECSANVSESDRFCSHCGHPLELVATNSVDARNGKIEALIFQVGRDIFYNPEQLESFEDSKALYDAVPKWRSPFTQAVLSWIGAILGVFRIVTLWKIIEPFLDMFRKGSTAPLTGAHIILWSTALVVVVVMHALVRSLRGLTKRETRRPLRLGWAISGYNHRVTLEKVKVSRRPSCNENEILHEVDRLVLPKQQWLDEACGHRKNFDAGVSEKSQTCIRSGSCGG